MNTSKADIKNYLERFGFDLLNYKDNRSKIRVQDKYSGQIMSLTYKKLR